MTTIRVHPEELETVAKHVPDAEDACQRARTTLSWEFPSLVMEIPGIGSAAIHELKDELLHWLDRYEEKLNEAEELLYRTAAAIRQADQKLADNMSEFGLELLGWYDVQRLFGEYDPITGERISGWDRLFAGGMLLASFIPPVKGVGIAGKAVVKGAKAAGIAADVSKLVSKTKNVLNYDKIKLFFQTIYHQVIKGPITKTIRSFKKQWENFLENVGSVLQGPQPAVEGVGAVPSGRMIGIVDESSNSVSISMSQAGDGVIGKGTGDVAKDIGKFKIVNGFEAKVHLGKQGKHIPGHPNYQVGKSIFTGDAQKLLDKYAGTGQWIGSNKERVDFKQVIGKWVDPNTGKAYETTKGIIHYSKNGAHIVPARP